MLPAAAERVSPRCRAERRLCTQGQTLGSVFVLSLWESEQVAGLQARGLHANERALEKALVHELSRGFSQSY